MLKNIKKKIVESYLRHKLNKVGRIEIKNNRLICSVDKEKLNKLYPDSGELFLDLNSQCYKKILKKFGFSPNITYVFDGCTMYGILTLSASGANIKFKDCTFANSVDILDANETTFEGNICLRNYFVKNKVSMLGKSKRINFSNATITTFPFVETNLFFESEYVSIVNSKMDLDVFSEFNLKGKTLDVIDSEIELASIKLDLEELMCGNSVIEASESARINVDSSMDIDAFNTKKLFVNGIQIMSIEEVMKEESSRRKFVDVLKTFSSECKKMNINETETVEKANQIIKKCSK